MQKWIALIGLNGTGKAQLAHDLSVYLHEQGYTTRRFDGTVARFEEAQMPPIIPTSDDILIWNTPAETDVEHLAALMVEVEAQSIQPLTIALLDTRTCDCFPTLREEMEQTADLTFWLPFDLKEALWKVSTALALSSSYS